VLVLVLLKFLIDGVASGNFVVFEGVHLIQVDVTVKILMSKLTEVNLADSVLDIRPFEGIGGLRSREHSCNSVNTSHFFFYYLL